MESPQEDELIVIGQHIAIWRESLWPDDFCTLYAKQPVSCILVVIAVLHIVRDLNRKIRQDCHKPLIESAVIERIEQETICGIRALALVAYIVRLDMARDHHLRYALPRDTASTFISSPSKVFAKEVGRWIPPGIGKGVDQAMPELTDDMRAQLQDLIDDANISVATEVGGLSSKLALTANSGSGSGSHSQTITNDNGIIVYVTYNGDGSEEDARRVGKQIGAETAREIRRRGLAPT